jgi:hypothetical protein
MRALLTFTLFVFFLCLIPSNAQAQCAGWKQNHQHWQIRAGIGLLPTFAKDHTTSEVSPLSMELRYRPSPRFSLGLLAGGSVSSVTQEHHSGSSLSLRNNFQLLALRAAVHTQRWEKWAPYAGISLAYQHSKVEEVGNSKEEDLEASLIHYTPRKAGVFYGAFIGTCYQPVPQLEIFGELGYGLSILTMGIGFSW